jgi:hypothetical protein
MRHGTLVASVIFGQPGSPIEGVAPACNGLVLPVFRDGSNGVAPCSQIELAHAILSALEYGAHVINISGGQLEPSGSPHPLLSGAIRRCKERNVLLVAAAGNDAAPCSHIPASHPYVLAVAAADASGRPLRSTNWATAYRDHGIIAPGDRIPGASPSGGVTCATGASVAASIVSGISALLLSLQIQRRRQPDPGGVRKAILGSARNDSQHPAHAVFGRLNLADTLDELGRGAVPMSDTVSTHAVSDDIESRNAGVGLSPSDTGLQSSAGAETLGQASEAVKPAACGCKDPNCGCAAKPQLVFAIGQLGFDFGTEARRDSIAQHMGGDPHNAQRLLAYLAQNPWEASAIQWTLSQDAVRIYAIRAAGAFAEQVYDRLREFLREQLAGTVEMVSLPGVIAGKTTLLSGETLPVVVPGLRGMYSWTTAALVEAVAGRPPAKGAAEKERAAHSQRSAAVRNFLERVYHELRNLGLAASERALNYAATNAFAVNEIFQAAIKDGMELDEIDVVRSPICRPESDCWDVKLTFFDPSRMLERARKVYRFTVDVSDVTPVTVGSVRSWSVR